MNILGQKMIRRYLAQGMASNRLSPSLLFVGPEGVGKRSVALELAKCFSCRDKENRSSSGDDLPRCDACTSCQRVSGKNHSDLLIIDRETQAIIVREKTETQTAIKIESIRHLDKFLRLLPIESERRTAIVDEAHKMTTEAANALLKVLEEPPPSAQIILVSLDEHSVPPTILSRCAVLRFQPVAAKDLSDWLQGTQGLGQEKAAEVAARAHGSFQKALGLMEEQQDAFDIDDYELDEFFELISNTNWKREGRKQAETALNRILESTHKKMEKGDLTQVTRIRTILAARRQIDRHVSPKLVLENLYLELTRQ